jgi:hypothetical protein
VDLFILTVVYCTVQQPPHHHYPHAWQQTCIKERFFNLTAENCGLQRRVLISKNTGIEMLRTNRGIVRAYCLPSVEADIWPATPYMPGCMEIPAGG